MQTSLNLEKYLAPLLVVLTLIGGVGIIAIAQSEPAKTIGLDIFLDVIAALSILGIWSYIIWKNWHTWKLWHKLISMLLMGFAILSTVNDVADNWPRLPWVKTGAFTTVDEFLTALQERDYVAAMADLTPRMQRCVDPADLNQQDTQPVDWELSEMDRFSNIKGTATFSDGQELELTVRTVWSDGQWQINGFWFGMRPEEKLDYSSMDCGE